MAEVVDEEGRESIRLVLTLTILVIIAGGFALYLSWPALRGETIILDTVPVDPFDPLRGQYMRIAYEVSSLPRLEGATLNDVVYVSLTEDPGGVFRSTGTSFEPPEGLFLRGRVHRVQGDEMELRYGIEQFFFERSAEVPTEAITVEAKVDAKGRAHVLRLLQYGEPVEIDYQPVTVTS